MPITPPEPRHTVEDTGDGLRFYIPPPRHWYVLLFLILWLFVWVGIGSQFVFGAFFRTTTGLDWFHVIWSVGWFLGTGYVIFTVAWMLVGVEVIDVSPQGIQARRQVFGLGRTRDYDGNHIRQLRASPMNYSAFNRSQSFESLGLAGGQIAFDYGAKTVRFGGGIDEAEARMIVDAIVQRFQRYQHK